MKNTISISWRGCALALVAASTFFVATARAEPDGQELLKSSDLSRGGGFAGLIWEVKTSNSGTGAEDQTDQQLRIKAISTSSVAEVLDPPNSKGSKMLQVERNMWMTKPGLRKPVAISPRQRLTGQAAIGDIAATNYAKDYTAKYLREEVLEGEACHVLELSAITRQATYDRITYWVSVKRGLAVKADFLSLSGKRLKSATFEYGNQVVVNGKPIPFVSRMTISDALTDAQTSIQYSRVALRAVPASEFDVANLQ